MISDSLQSVLDAKGHILVLGGPGSGKTTIALRKGIKRIEEGLLPGQVVLFLSFSRAAVARIAEASNSEAPKDKKGLLSMQTFHSFCWELLRCHGYLLGAPKKLQILLPHDEKALSAGITPKSKEWPAWIAERERLFKEEGRVAFDLFAPKAFELLSRSALIRDLITCRFPLVIVDEAQDTGPEAWRCIEKMAQYVQVLCLADLEQQIFDYLPGVGPERIVQIEKVLNPLRVDLGSVNNRSPGTEIVFYGNDILACKLKKSPYTGVTIHNYNPKTQDFSSLIRSAVGRLYRTIQSETGALPNNCAFLVPTGAEVARISTALNSGTKSIPHKVIFDEAEVMLASRLAAFLLEPKAEASHNNDVAQGLELLANIRRAGGKQTAIGQANSMVKWAEQLRQGKNPNTNAVKAMSALIHSVRTLELSGQPRNDWLVIKKMLQSSGDALIKATAEHLDYLAAFNRGKRIAANLSAAWNGAGAYVKARESLDEALAEDWILSGLEDLSGIHVMTIHRSKGKQFDGVIIYREGKRESSGKWVSSLVWRGDPAPHYRSRKILRVAITRARCHVLILNPFYPTCPIVSL